MASNKNFYMKINSWLHTQWIWKYNGRNKSHLKSSNQIKSKSQNKTKIAKDKPNKECAEPIWRKTLNYKEVFPKTFKSWINDKAEWEDTQMVPENRD